MNILLHICCSNCALYPVSDLRSRGEKITGFWFNPNIHPLVEYQNRLNSVRRLEALWGLDMLYEDFYGLIPFVRAVAGKENQRCQTCYFMRLEETARQAKDHGFEAFSTSLLISPYQNQDLLRKTGDFLAEQYNVEFLFRDFREGFRETQQRGSQMGLYRQRYCGCIYSEAERGCRKKRAGENLRSTPARSSPRG